MGERGVTLSGGQKARVNLARAVYHRAQVCLLDDPLSAVDTVVARHIFDKWGNCPDPFRGQVIPAVVMWSLSHLRCIRGLLKKSIVVLVTHQVQFAEQADKILAMKDVG